MDEAAGSSYMYTNDVLGYKRWYKKHLLTLCEKYHNAAIFRYN